MRALLLLLISTVLLSGCHSRKLDHEEIRALLSDSEVTGQHERRNYEFNRIYRSDGTFTQVRRGSDRVESATWWTSGRRDICIRWDSEVRDYCRTMHTNDQGAYWKSMEHGDGRKTVVTYRSFKDLETGADKRVILTGLPLYRNMLLSPGGLIFLGVLLVLLFKGAKKLHSDRQQRQVRLGGKVYKRAELRRLSESELSRFIHRALKEREFRVVPWGYEALCQRMSLQWEAFALIWRVLKVENDAVIQEALQYLIRDATTWSAAELQALLKQQNDPRLTFLVGRAYMEEATLHRSSSETTFDERKAQAMSAFDLLRAEGGAPALAALAATTGYAAMSGPLVEQLVYMRYTPPPRRRSSSYSSGG